MAHLSLGNPLRSNLPTCIQKSHTHTHTHLDMNTCTHDHSCSPLNWEGWGCFNLIHWCFYTEWPIKEMWPWPIDPPPPCSHTVSWKSICTPKSFSHFVLLQPLYCILLRFCVTGQLKVVYNCEEKGRSEKRGMGVFGPLFSSLHPETRSLHTSN